MTKAEGRMEANFLLFDALQTRFASFCKICSKKIWPEKFSNLILT